MQLLPKKYNKEKVRASRRESRARGERASERHGQVRRLFTSAVALLLCVVLTGCSTILGDSPVVVETAPSIITPRVAVVDAYGAGDSERFNIEGVDGFYLLPGIENYPDNLQDFSCLDYTDAGYFIYYYCAPSYVSAEYVKAYKGMSGIAPVGKYGSGGQYTITETTDPGSTDAGGSGTNDAGDDGEPPATVLIGEETVALSEESPCDAMIVMAYRPDTRAYYVMDAQAYSKDTANSLTDGEANTGMDFYASSDWGFYTLSHCYGCKIAGEHRYFIFDQSGSANVWDDSLQLVSHMVVGGLITGKVNEVAAQRNLSGVSGTSQTSTQLNIDMSGYMHTETNNNAGSLEGDDSDEAKEGRESVKKELAEVMGKNESAYDGDEEQLSCLIKSAVMDETGIMYYSLLLYRGTAPWISPILLDRVVSIYSFDISEIQFISRNSNYEAQVAALQSQETGGEFKDMTQIKQSGDLADDFTPFASQKEGFTAYIGGYGDLSADSDRGFLGLGNAYTFSTNKALVAYIQYRVATSTDSFFGVKSTASFYGTTDWLFDNGGGVVDYYSEDARRSQGYDVNMGFLFGFLYNLGIYDGFDWDLVSQDWTGLQKELAQNIDPHALSGGIRDNWADVRKYGYITHNGYWLGGERWQSADEAIRRCYFALPDDVQEAMKQSLLSYYYQVGKHYSENASWLDFIFGSQRSYDMSTWAGYAEFLTDFGLVERPGHYFPDEAIPNSTTFPDSPEETEVDQWGRTVDNQVLMLFHGTNVDYTTELTSLPRAYLLELPEGTNAWVEPYEWNEEIDYYYGGGDTTEWVHDRSAAKQPGTTRGNFRYPASSDFYQDIWTVRNNYFSQHYTETELYQRVEQVFRRYEEAYQGDSMEEDIETEVMAILGRVKRTVHVDAVNYVVPANSFPISYIMHFPKGTMVQAVDMDNTSGSTTASVTTGALLFADEAQTQNNTLTFTSSIRWQREAGVVLNDKDVPGAAIDSGALEFGTGTNKKLMPILITDEGVKFYSVYERSGKATGYPVYVRNEDILTSTGFTPYTESATQAAVAKKLGNGVTDAQADKYGDAEGASSATEQKISQSLNSSRVGTIQSASSFTVLSDEEVLISAYDTGLTLLRLPNGQGQVNQMNLQSGSFYQTFPVGTNGNCVVLGFNTEEYMYGSMDLARAKVYNFNFGTSRDEIYLNAFTGHLDQLAMDYVRRLHRTRTSFTFDNEGNITGQKAVLIDFTDDHDEEAETERRLFAGDAGTADAELKAQEAAIGMTHQAAAGDYLTALRKQVADQQAALKEVLALTGATKLGSGKLESDAYWVGLQERLQATTELGDLKDLLVEAATAEDVVKLKSADERADYEEKREVINYRAEDTEMNDALGDEDSIGAEEFVKLLEQRKTEEDFDESYDMAQRGKKKAENPLYEYLNTENLTAQLKKKGEPEGRSAVRQDVLDDIEENYFTAHPLEPEAVYAPDGSYEMRVTKDRMDEVWDDYLEGLLTRISPDNLTVTRTEVTEEEKQEIRAIGSTAAKVMAQLVEFLCEDAGEVSQETKIEMVEDLLNGMEMVGGAQLAEEAVLIERMTLPKFSVYRPAYDAFNSADYSEETPAVESEGIGASQDPVLSTEASNRLVAYEEQEFYKRVILPMKESALVQAYLATNNYTWEQYMASLPTVVATEVQAGGGDWEAEAQAVYENFEPFQMPEVAEEAGTRRDDIN